MPLFSIQDPPKITIDKERPPNLQVDEESINGRQDPKTTHDTEFSWPRSAEGGTVPPKTRKNYMLADPTVPAEKNRLDQQHLIFRETLSGELFSAPIKELDGGLHNVLDIATGTGIWAADFAKQFPTANITGTDLSLPTAKSYPPNCHFEIKDAEDPWEFPRQFDYIHGRALATCFNSHLGVIKSAFSSLRPGGYLELQDCVVPFHSIDTAFEGSRFENWNQHMMKSSVALGRDWTRVAKYKQYLEEVGFEDVVEQRYEWPIGTWARGEKMKKIGEWYRDDILSLMEQVSMASLTRGLGMTAEEIYALLEGVRDEMMSDRTHLYTPVRVVCGRKPK